MSDAVSLVVGALRGYFSNIVDPLAVGPLSLIPFVGIVCLAAGLVIGGWKRETRLWRFGYPFLACLVLIAVAGVLRGSLAGTKSGIVLVPFLVVVLGWSGYLVYKAKGVRIPALLLAVFTLSFAAYASFVSGMSFADTWL